jgi:hypothetical protein
MTDSHEYRLTIEFVISPNASKEEISAFVKTVQVSSCLNAGDNEEGPFLHGEVTDVQIKRVPSHD